MALEPHRKSLFTIRMETVFNRTNAQGAGDVKGNTGKILSLERPSNTSLHIVTLPLQWPCDNVPCECTFERVISLNGQRVDVTAILHNNRSDRKENKNHPQHKSDSADFAHKMYLLRSDHTDYGPHTQELPAMYSIGTLYRLLTYNGSAPWTNGSLSEYSTAPYTPWHPGNFPATEHWAAMINDEDWGMAMVNFGTGTFKGGFNGQPDKGGTADDDCGYIAPIDSVDLTWDIQYKFKFSLVLGYLHDIRSIVYEMHENSTDS